jgi:hypothetical protein
MPVEESKYFERRICREMNPDFSNQPIETHIMNREIYLKTFKAQLDAWNVDMDRLEDKVGRVGADAKIECEKEITAIRKCMREARKKVDEIHSASENEWEGLRQGAEDAWIHLKNGIEKAKSEFE